MLRETCRDALPDDDFIVLFVQQYVATQIVLGIMEGGAQRAPAVYIKCFLW